MKIQIDLKSALAGLALGIAAMFCVGAETSSNPVGRFQVAGGTGASGANFIILDTATGKAWQGGTGLLTQFVPDFFNPK